jgi:uncharacterized repeat protein (TIGR03803 family)
MQKDPLRNIPVMLTCIVLLAPIGCGGGGGSSSSGSGETTYTLGGTLAGLDLSQSVSLQDNGGDTLTLSANGTFSFPMRLDAGTAYAITVQSHTPGIACSVGNGSGTLGSSDVTGVGVSCSVGTERILYSFGANATDGQEPYAGVIRDSAGNLYGTTQTGGAIGLGTVFKITAAGTETILHSFGSSATDGQTPRAGVIMDNAGNLYGTTLMGGANQIGTVFKIDTSGTETILYSFGARANDGMDPDGGLITDSAGNLYGTTSAGGSGGTGTVYKIDPAGTETILYSFGVGNTDGAAPSGDLIMDSAGNLYGTTAQGGAYFEGTAFKISAAGSEKILHSFGPSVTDALVPAAGLIMDSAGDLYGTTEQGGANVSGTVFKIDAAGTETILYSFAASVTDGRGPGPYMGLIMDSTGSLYGTTASGGANHNDLFGDGTVFTLGVAGTETILHSFGANATDGLAPFAGLIVDSAGNLYGTTVNGGANFGRTMNGEVNGGGTVFVID